MPTGWAEVDDVVALSGLEGAYSLGANLFDTADVYGHGRSERLVGRLVDQVDRNSLVLVSKVGYFAGTAPHGYHPGHMRHQLEQSLDNLHTDYLDVYFLHPAVEDFSSFVELRWRPGDHQRACPVQINFRSLGNISVLATPSPQLRRCGCTPGRSLMIDFPKPGLRSSQPLLSPQVSTPENADPSQTLARPEGHRNGHERVVRRRLLRVANPRPTQRA